MSSSSRRRGRGKGKGKASAKRTGKSVMDGVDVDDDMRDFIFDIEHSAKKILKSYNKRVLHEVARAKVEARKEPKQAWPPQSTYGSDMFGQSSYGAGAGPGSTGSSYPPASPGFGQTMGSMGSSGFMSPDVTANMRGTAGFGGNTTFMDRPSAASRLMGGTASNGKARKTVSAAVPFHLEETATELARTALPPLAPSGLQAASAASAANGTGLSLSQSMSLVQQAAGYGASRTGFTGGAGMPSTMPSDPGTRRAETAALSLTRTRMSARTRRKLAKLRQSPLAVSRADPSARAATAPAKGSAMPIGQSLKLLKSVSGHQHTHGSDHAVERRMCKACWSQPTKIASTEGGLRSMALGLTKELEVQGPTNWASDDLRTKYRDEQTRDEAWEACQEALRDAEILEREQGVVVPVVIVDKHPVHRGVHQQIDEENSMSQRRARARNAMKVFSFDVRAVWLSGEIPNEAPATSRSHGSVSTMSASVMSHRGGGGDASRGLSGRRDATSISAGHHQVQSVAFIRTMADAVATELDPAMEEAAAHTAATRRMSVDSELTTSTAAASVAPPEPLGLFPGRARLELPWFRKGVKLVHGVRRPPDRDGNVALESSRGLKSFVTVMLELTVHGTETTVVPPQPGSSDEDQARQARLQRRHEEEAAARAQGSTDVPEFALQGAKLTAPARVTGVVLRACALGTFETHTVRISLQEFRDQLDAQCARELEKASQAYAVLAAELQEMETELQREAELQEARYGKRRAAGEEVPPRLLHLRRETAIAHNTVAELQQYAARNPLNAGAFPVAFTVAVAKAKESTATVSNPRDPKLGRIEPSDVVNDNVLLTAVHGTYRPMAPPESVMNRLMRLLRFVVVAVPAPMPLRGSRARLSVAAMRGDWRSEFDSERPADPHGFIGDRREVETYTNHQQRAGTEVREFGWNTTAHGDMAHHLWLNQFSDYRAEAWSFMAGRETQQQVPNRFPTPYEQAALQTVSAIREAMDQRQDLMDSDMWGKHAPVGACAGYTPVLNHPAAPPHLNDAVPNLPLPALVSGFLQQLHAVPGLTVVGTYVTSAAIFVRDPAISSTEGITVTLANGLETPFLAPRLQALNEEAIYPKRRKELLCVDATPSTVAPVGLSVLVSVLDERLPHTVPVCSGAAEPEIDATSLIPGHRRAGPLHDPATRFRMYDVKKLLVPKPGLETRPFGITMGAATLNAQDVWPQRYTWHSEVAVKHGRENTAQDFYYVLCKKFTQGPNDPNRFTARMLHERVRRLDASSLSEFLKAEEQRRIAAEEQARKEELARKVEAGRRAKARREAEKTNLAFQWRQKNIRRAARLRGKTAALGLSHAEWTAKRRKPGARCVARFAGWERWVILVPREAVKQAELLEAGDGADTSVSRPGTSASSGHDSGGDVYSEVWYYEPQSANSQWDPPPVWPEDEWDAEEEEDAEVLYDSDGNSITGDYQSELDRTVLRSRASRRSMKSRQASRAASRTDQATTAAREQFMVSVLERALRRWAIESAIEGVPTHTNPDGSVARPRDRATTTVVSTARTGSTGPSRRSTQTSLHFAGSESKGVEGGIGADGDVDLDYETDDDVELGVQGRGSGLDSRGDGLFDLRHSYEFLDADGDGLVNMRDWAKVSSTRSGASLSGGQLPDGERPVVGETAEGGAAPVLMAMLWPFVTETLQRTTPAALRSYVHDAIPAVAAHEYEMHTAATPTPVNRPSSASELFARDHPLAEEENVVAAEAGAQGSRTATALTVPGGRSGTRKSILKAGTRRSSAMTQGSHAMEAVESGVVGFAVDPHDVHHQIEQLMTPNVRLHFFRQMQEQSPGEGFTYNDWVAFVARVRHEDNFFGIDPELWRMPAESWEAMETRVGVARAVGSWSKHEDPTSGDVYYKSSLTGQTVWEKSREHLLAEKKLRRLCVTRVDAEIFAEQSQQRRRWRQATKAKRIADARAAQVKADKLAGRHKRASAAADSRDGVSGAKATGGGSGTDAGAAPDTAEGDVDSLVNTLSSNPKLIAALAKKLGLGAPDDMGGQPDVSRSRPGSALRTSGQPPRNRGSRVSMQVPADTAPALKAGGAPSPVPKLKIGLAGLPEGQFKTRTTNGPRASTVSFRESGAGAGTHAGGEMVVAGESRRDAAVRRLRLMHSPACYSPSRLALMRVCGGKAGSRTRHVPGRWLAPAARSKGTARTCLCGLAVDSRCGLPSQKAKNLKARSKETQVLGPHVTKLNAPNAASIVALVDPAEAMPYSMKYAGPGLQPLLVMDVTADMEERHRQEEAFREANAIASRPVSAGTSVGGLTTARPGTGMSARTLNARNAGLSGPESSVAVLNALGDPERKLSEEELKAQLRFKAFLAVKNNKYDNVRACVCVCVRARAPQASVFCAGIRRAGVWADAVVHAVGDAVGRGSTRKRKGREWQHTADCGRPERFKANLQAASAAWGVYERNSRLCCAEIAKWFSNALVFCQNLRGNTALHYSYAYKFTELGDYLLSKGADDSIVNAEGLTCYEGLDQDAVDAL